MTVALDYTLVTLGISSMVFKGGWERIVQRMTTSTDIFIGAGVTEDGETQPDIDLCAEIEALLGIVLGYAWSADMTDTSYFYRDYDNPFGDNKWVDVGIPRHGSVYLVLAETNTSIGRGDKIKCVDGVWKPADTNDNFQMIAEEAVTGASNTRKYFWARWVKN